MSQFIFDRGRSGRTIDGKDGAKPDKADANLHSCAWQLPVVLMLPVVYPTLNAGNDGMFTCSSSCPPAVAASSGMAYPDTGGGPLRPNMVVRMLLPLPPAAAVLPAAVRAAACSVRDACRFVTHTRQSASYPDILTPSHGGEDVAATAGRLTIAAVGAAVRSASGTLKSVLRTLNIENRRLSQGLRWILALLLPFGHWPCSACVHDARYMLVSTVTQRAQQEGLAHLDSSPRMTVLTSARSIIVSY